MNDDAEAEGDRLRKVVDTYKSVFIDVEDRLRTELASVTEERDRLRAVVEHAVEVLGKVKAPPAGLLSVVSLMRLALDDSAEATDG